jgi:PPOX class probable F420-dependent enzyme
MSAVTGLHAFAGNKYLNLETFRRNGVGVRTPVWFAAAAGGQPLYIYSTADSGAVKIAPCDARGKVMGEWVDAHAAIVSQDEFQLGMRLLNRKYWPLKQMLDLSVLLFARHQRVVIAIRTGTGTNG